MGKAGISFSNRTLIAPSLLSADFGRLAEEVAEVEKGGADWLHVDVMDGHFVPNLTIGPLVVEALRKRTKLPLDCHLMVSEPEKWVEPFAKAGASVITVHQEAAVHLDRLLDSIRAQGCLAGVSINPATPVRVLEEVLDSVDLVLIMSVNPGFGGQKFIRNSLKKIQTLQAMIGKREIFIEVDGGVEPKTAEELRESGAQIFVAGNAIFGQKDRTAALKSLRKAIG